VTPVRKAMVARTATFSFVVPAAIRSFGDDNWKETDTAYMETWKAAVSLFRERQITIEGVSHVVTIDWTPLLRCHQRHFQAMTYVSRDRSSNHDRLARARFPRRTSQIPVTIKTDGKEKNSPRGVAESIIYDVFLMMNIAAPGCCNFYRAKLIGQGVPAEISLSSSEFELCVLPSRQRRPHST
jgi:hypothetical protein